MSRLLFLETFFHDITEEFNIDLIRIPNGCYASVTEIRIIPGGARIPIEDVEQKQGLTAPNSFRLEVFATNFAQPTSSTFEQVATFDYNFDSDIQIQLSATITDTILLKGGYSSLTVAVYGDIVEQTDVNASLMPNESVVFGAGASRLPPPPIATDGAALVGGSLPYGAPAQQTLVVGAPIPTWVGAAPPVIHIAPTFNPLVPPPLSIISPAAAAAAGGYAPTGVLPAPFDPTRPPPTFAPQQQQSPKFLQQQTSPSERVSRRELKLKSNEAKSIDIVGSGSSKPMTSSNLSVPQILHRRGGMDELQLEEGEYANSDGDSIEKFDLENISEEEFEFDDSMASEVDYNELHEDLLSDVRFNPYAFNIQPLIHFKNPCLSAFQIEQLEINDKYIDDDIPEDTSKLLDIMDSVEHYRDENWVRNLEKASGLIKTGLAYIATKCDRSDIVEKLVSCAIDGLDMDMVLQQTQAIFTLRHLKVGIRLSSTLLTTDPKIASELLNKHIQHRLIDLLESDTTTIPVALQILRALDSSLFFEIGLKAFCQQTTAIHSSTPFQRLTTYTRKKRPVRVLEAIHRLMRKITLHTALMRLFMVTQRVAASVSNHITDEDDGSSISSDAENSLDEADIVCICENVSLINYIYCNANEILAQAVDSLPTTTILEYRPSSDDAYPFVLSQFDNNYLLHSVFLLLTHSVSGTEPRIVTAIHQLLSSLLSRKKGLLYLASRSDITQEMLKFLLQSSEDPQEEQDTSVMQQLGLEAAYQLQALHYIDELMHFHQSGVVQLEVDNAIALATLQSFYVLTLDLSNGQKGLRGVVRVLTWDNHLASILPFIELTGEAEWDNKIRKSACAGYASELLLLMMRHSQSIEFLKTHADRLIALSNQEVTSKVAELKQWIEPLRKPGAFGVEIIETLVEKLKLVLQQEGGLSRIPKHLITSMRLTCSISVEPPRDIGPGIFSNFQTLEELRFKHALVQLHQAEVLSMLLQLIDKLADSQLLNWQQGISLSNKHGYLFYACVLPTVSIIRAVLCVLIKCRDSSFDNMTCLSPLLKLYMVCCTMSPSYNILSEAQLVQAEITAILLAFTQPKLAEAKGDATEILESSLWTKMVSKVLEFTVEAPYCFVAGSRLLSELLPLPLPVPTKQPLLPKEILLIQSNRRLWATHLLPLAEKTQAFIHDFAHSTQHTLQQGLRRVCLQMSDLSPSSANIVVQSIVDVILENAESIVTGESETTEEANANSAIRRELKLPAGAELARVLNLLSYMTSQASFKVALLNLIQAKKDGQAGGCSRLAHYFLSILNFTSSERSHEICQELIISTLQSFCDDEITVVTTSSDNVSSNDQTFLCIPEQNLLTEICCALLKHIGIVSQKYATVLPAVRILVMLCKHDCGLECIKKALNTEPRSLLTFLERLLEEFSANSSDCLSTLSTLLELLKSLRSIDDSTSSTRTKRVSADTVREILEWQLNLSNQEHCLVKLHHMVADAVAEESTLTSLHEEIGNLINELQSPSTATDEADNLDQSTVPLPMNINEHFASRQLWIVCNDLRSVEDRLQSHYWFPVEILDEDDDHEMDKSVCELETLRAQYLADFDLAKELAVKISAKRAEEAEALKRKAKPAIINTSRGERRRFVAPLRGRGFVYRGSMASRANDPFRSRPPNTSRPPSMHVDDFILAQHIHAPSSSNDAADTSKAKDTGRAAPRMDRAGSNRSNRYRMGSPIDGKGRNVSRINSGLGLAGKPLGIRHKGNAFDRPRGRHGSNRSGGGGKTRPPGSRKFAVRHRPLLK